MMRSRGFTLLELLVVLVLAMLLLGLAPPLVSAALPGVELRAGARELAAALRMTRNLALTGERETLLEFDLATRSYRIPGNSAPRRLPRETTVQLLTAESELTGARSGAIRFFPEGGSTGGRITLSRAGLTLTVDVDWLTGRVRVLQGDDER